MTREEFIIQLFCWVDDTMGEVPKHPQAKLYPSELVTVGLLVALRGGMFSSCYRWLQSEVRPLIGALPERTRLQRALWTQRHSWCRLDR